MGAGLEVRAPGPALSPLSGGGIAIYAADPIPVDGVEPTLEFLRQRTAEDLEILWSVIRQRPSSQPSKILRIRVRRW